MSDTRKPALSTAEMMKKYPGIFTDGNKKLEEQGISSLIIPASQQLSPEEIRVRIELFKKEK